MLLAKSDINREVPSVVTSTGPLKLAAVPVPFAEPLVVEPTTVVTTPERLNSTVAAPPNVVVVAAAEVLLDSSLLHDVSVDINKVIDINKNILFIYCF